MRARCCSTNAHPVVTSTPASQQCLTAAALMAASVEAAPVKPLVPRPSPYSDRDIGRRPRVAVHGQARGSITVDSARLRAHPAGRSEAAFRLPALPLSPELTTDGGWSHCVDGMENSKGNRFAGSELCDECGEPYSDSNYVATTADGSSYCGDCWDTFLGVTLVVGPQPLHAGAHNMCACSQDLSTEPWFTVERTVQQTPYCRSCSLAYWGMASSDFTVTIIDDNTEATGPSLSAPIVPSFTGSSPSALADRGFPSTTYETGMPLPGKTACTCGQCRNAHAARQHGRTPADTFVSRSTILLGMLRSLPGRQMSPPQPGRHVPQAALPRCMLPSLRGH